MTVTLVAGLNINSDGFGHPDPKEMLPDYMKGLLCSRVSNTNVDMSIFHNFVNKVTGRYYKRATNNP